MKPKELAVLEMCIENGIAYGLGRAYKHTDEPGEAYKLDVIKNAIMHEIYEWFDFEENEAWNN